MRATRLFRDLPESGSHIDGVTSLATGYDPADRSRAPSDDSLIQAVTTEIRAAIAALGSYLNGLLPGCRYLGAVTRPIR
jgi:hypothetical protein